MADLNALFKLISRSDSDADNKRILVCGLGNPGEKYVYTRHNAGFLFLDYLCQMQKTRLSKVRFKSVCGECSMSGKKLILMKPQTFMNNSGEAVREAMDFYKLGPADLVVISDDLSLPIGRIRIRRKGSHGGQNGLKSIINHIGSEEFARIKIGVGQPPEGYDYADWVLSDIPKPNQQDFFNAIENAYKALPFIIEDKIDCAMNLYN
ncbi:MAG: aminoacyl-tRNA hydrolase [Clostridia bacterium]|nr:aminoacyl-tRNA hydrolase [Clostridia bacterium]